MTLQAGHTFISGRNRTTARDLLDTAARLGLDPSIVVQTRSAGYVVPDEVADALTAPAPDEVF